MRKTSGRLVGALAAMVMGASVASAPACWGGVSGGEDCVIEKTRAELVNADHNARVRALVGAAVQRSGQRTAEGAVLSPMPEGTELARLAFPKTRENGDAQHVGIYLDLPEAFVESDEFTAFRLNAIGQEFVHALMLEDINGYFLYIRDPKTGEYLEPDEIIPPEPVKEWTPPIDEATVKMAERLGVDPMPERNQMPVINPGQPQGSLSGKTVFINQSHGWFDDFEVVNRYRVQRGHSFGTLEDFDSGEFINLYVLPMLRNAGAKVMTVRESDHQTNMVIVDNEDGTSNPSNGVYRETGTWATSSISGFRQKTTASWNGVTVNPFNQGTGANRLSDGLTTGTPTATATWVANIPEDGYYNVYASWAAFSGRAQDAQYLVHHSGGVSELRMDQTIDGYTWVLLGNWYFEAGAPEDERKVVLTNSSQDPDAVNVSADAVRWGGGMGDFARHTNGVSNRPRWEEEAVLYLQFNGMGYSGSHYTGTDDEAGGWSDRPQYARWEHSQKDGSVEDAVYFAWHTNAFNGSARGLTTYRHGTATAASTTLQNIMHDKTYDAINSLWFTGETWTVRSKNVQNFGENNQSSLGSGLPGFLFEGLFHDNETDSTSYNEPRFRYLMARAITQGLIDYFNDRDNSSLIYPPESPENFRVEYLGNGEARLNWGPGPSGGFNGGAAQSYRLYRSKNGFGFDDGTVANGTSTVVSGIADDETTYFRVAAANNGGESFPTETLAVKGGTERNVLLVNAFDRNQRSLIPTETIPNAGIDLRRHVPHTFQAFNYVIEHAEALEPLGYTISSTCNEQVASGAVDLSLYDVVIWIAGEESTLDDTVSEQEQARLAAYAPNGRLFISGAEIGWDLGRAGDSSPDDLAFYNSVLYTTYVDDDAATYNVSGASGTPFESVGSFNFSPSSGARYDADWPDEIAPAFGSSAMLTYAGGATAAVGYVSQTNGVFSMGFPFETISTESAREAVMAAAMDYLFSLQQTPTPSPSPSPSPSPTPTATATPTATPTVTPSPTVEEPPSVDFEFDDAPEGWTFTNPPVFAEMIGEVTSGTLDIIATDNTNSFGFFESPEFRIGEDPGDADGIVYIDGEEGDGSLYKTTWTVFSDLEDRSLAPVMRLRSSSFDFQRSDLMVATSVGDGGNSPNTSPTMYTQYFSQPAGEESFRLDFDILNADPMDAASVRMSLDAVRVEALSESRLSGGTPVVSLDLSSTTDTMGWTPFDAAPLLAAPEVFQMAENGLLIRGIDTASSPTMTTETPDTIFGYWVLESDVPFAAGNLYRVSWTISSDATAENYTALPTFRLRVNDSSLRYAALTNIDSVNASADVPAGEARTYHLWVNPADVIAGGTWTLAFDYLYTDKPVDVDDPTLGITVENIEVTAYPTP